VCEHLVLDPVQRWHSAAPSEAKRWPDAWCANCNLEFLKEGQWNQRNEKGLIAKMLCHKCYEAAQARSVGRLRGNAEKAWSGLLADSIAAAQRKQQLLENDFQLGRHKRWDWDQEKAQPVFSNDGIPALRCDIAFVGSVSTVSNTWLWSWANFSLTEAVRTVMEKVRAFGEARDFPKLIVPKWPARETDGWEMSSVAIEVLGARGIYRTPSQSGFTFLAILEARGLQ
jgi:hypothetical protein